MTIWLGYFALTVAVEFAVVASLLRARGIAPGAAPAAVLVANLMTHPLAWAWLHAERDPCRQLVIFVACELFFVPLAEGLLYAKAAGLELRVATGVSYIANAASCCAGLVLSFLSA